VGRVPGHGSGRDLTEASGSRQGRPGSRRALLEVLAASLRLGLTSFGGPIAHLGYFRREYVERRGWLDDARFADLLALCQALPGPASSQLGIAIGTLRAGRLGGVVSWLGFTLPSAVLLVAFALLTGSADLADAGWIRGLKLAAVAVVAQAVVAMWRSLAPDAPRSALVVAAAIVALAVPSPITQVAIIAAGGLAGFLVLAAPLEAGHAGTRRASPGDHRVALACLATFGILLVGLPVLRETVASQGVALVDTFYRAGSLVFGGGHVVLPILHESVVAPGWVPDDRFLAGYGAAQAVPGPLFTFAGFLGASMATAPTGLAGAALALGAIFLPSFLLVWAVLPFWDAIRARSDVRRALGGVNAAVVGVLLAALVTPLWTGAVATPAHAAIAVAGALALVAARVSPIVVVVAAALLTEVVARLP
jgi:chromate transporter